MLVTWIHVASRPDELENLGHIVLRYLLYAADTGPRSSAALTVIPSDNAQGGRYVVEQECEQKMTWMDRLRKWTRWVKPVSQTWSEQSVTHLFEIPPSLLAHPLEVQSKREMGDEASRSEQALGPAGWSSMVKTDTRAVFGHILHAQQGANSPLVSPTADFDSSRQHTFLPVNPPLQSLTFPTNLLETGLYHAILVMRFVPAPTQASAAQALAATAPPLELRIEIDHREVKRIISVRLVTGTHTGDVMLPSYPVDARLVQTSYVELEGRFVDKHAPPVLDFLNQSDIRPWDGKLENPPSLDGIQVPSSLFLRKDTTAAGEDDSDSSNAVDSAESLSTPNNKQDASRKSKPKPIEATSYTAVAAPIDDKEYTILQTISCLRFCEKKDTARCITCIQKQSSYGACRFNGIRLYCEGRSKYAFRGNQSVELEASPQAPAHKDLKIGKKYTRSKRAVREESEDIKPEKKGGRVYPIPKLDDLLSPKDSDAKYALPAIAEAFAVHIRREGWHEGVHAGLLDDSEFPGGARPMIRIHDTLSTRSTCDVCSTSIFMGSYMCGSCGKEFCLGRYQSASYHLTSKTLLRCIRLL